MLSQEPLLQEGTADTSREQRSSKLKWGLASLAIVVTPVGGTALAAYVAGFNLATMAAAIFPQGTWLSSALTTLGHLTSVTALNPVVGSAAIVAGGILSVAVIGLSALLLNVIYNKIVSMVSRNSAGTIDSDPSQASSIDNDAQEQANPHAAPAATTLSLSASADADGTVAPTQQATVQKPESSEGLHADQPDGNVDVDETPVSAASLSCTQTAAVTTTAPSAGADNDAQEQANPHATTADELSQTTTADALREIVAQTYASVSQFFGS